MKTPLTTLLLAFSLNHGFCQQNDAEQLKRLNANWIKCYVTKDTATMAAIFADDLILISPSGRAFSKKDILRNVMAPGQQFLSSRIDAVSVRLFGEIGLVNSTSTVVAKTKDGTSTIQTCYLDVYEKRNNRWVAVAAHVTLLSEK